MKGGKGTLEFERNVTASQLATPLPVLSVPVQAISPTSPQSLGHASRPKLPNTTLPPFGREGEGEERSPAHAMVKQTKPPPNKRGQR